jgi:carbonic anhydrase/acetyltransferase-like protein (isoleucine patch superfamily)
VTIGDDCEIGEDVTLDKYVTAGDNFKVGNNTFIKKNVTIGDDVELGEDLIINQGVEIGSNVTIGNATVIGKDANIGNYVTIGDGVLMGQNVTVDSGVFISDFAEISANTPVSLVFTPEMLQGKVFFNSQEELWILQFAADGTGASTHVHGIYPFDWLIDGNGILFIDNPGTDPDEVVTLLAETATYFDAQFFDGTNTVNFRLTKVIPFDAATLPGTYSVSNGFTGVGTFVDDGTGSASDGSETINFNWSVDPAGILSLTATDGGSNTDYLLATSTPPSTLYVVGIAQNIDGSLDDVFFEIWTRLP